MRKLPNDTGSEWIRYLAWNWREWQNFFKVPEFTIHTPNITPDKETGTGSWTDDQIITAIREGRRPDGAMIGTIMPIGLYRDISDIDTKAVVAYLKSVPPVRHEVPR